VDIEFAAPETVAAQMEVNATNCFNSSDLSFNNVFSIGIGNSAPTSRAISAGSYLPLAALLMWALL
jgi:hypothetical protein